MRWLSMMGEQGMPVRFVPMPGGKKLTALRIGYYIDEVMNTHGKETLRHCTICVEQATRPPGQSSSPARLRGNFADDFCSATLSSADVEEASDGRGPIFHDVQT